MMSDVTDRLKDLFADDRAVSPVVGVALLIAITVILAAVIGFVVLDTTDSQNAASADARLSVTETDSTDDNYRISHDGGDGIQNANIVIRNTDTGSTVGSASITFNTGDSAFNTGESIQVNGLSDGDTYSVVIQDPNSDRESVLTRFTA